MPETPPIPDVLTQLVLQNPPRSAADMRRMIDSFAAFMNADLPEIGAFHEGVSIGDGVSADVVVPKAPGPHPVVVYLHGGGWICGSARTHRKLGFRLAEAGFLVLNVDYRLAPEHPFPTPFQDCVAALRFARREATRWGGDPERIAVAGDSAGGNLAAAASTALADDPARPKAAVLIYGVFDFATIGQGAIPGISTDGPLADLGRQMIELMVRSYLGDDPDAARHADPRVSPLHAAHRLPPSHVVVGSADPLAAQAEALVKTLSAAGVRHEHFVDAGMPHGYFQMEFLAPSRPALARAIAFLRKHV
jgi:acetyl esterase